MNKIRIYDLAQELKISSHLLIEEVRLKGVDVCVPSNTISKELADMIRRKLDPQEQSALRAMRDVQLKQVIKSAGKAFRYSQEDPETALLHARKAAEAICRDLYINAYSKTPDDLTLSRLIENLSKNEPILPKKVMHSLRVIQIFGGANAHEDIDDCSGPALGFFQIIVNWYFKVYRNECVPEQIHFTALQ